MIRRLLLAAALCGCLAGCRDDAQSIGGGGLQVAATTALAADLVRAVGADRVEVSTLIPANADPHEYEPRPRDVSALADAELVVRSGGELDDWLADGIDSAGADGPVLTLIEGVQAKAGDPHWWHDPRNVMQAVRSIRDELTSLDAAGAADYSAAADAYLTRLGKLDADVAQCIDSIPRARRKLVTSHDALGYFARRYRLEVIGTVIPSRSTRGQASAGEIAELADTIRAAGVRVIFAESSVNPKVERAVARETGARVARPLYADGLGPEGSAGATYLDAMRFNARAIADGLGGQASSCGLGG